MVAALARNFDLVARSFAWKIDGKYVVSNYESASKGFSKVITDPAGTLAVPKDFGLNANYIAGLTRQVEPLSYLICGADLFLAAGTHHLSLRIAAETKPYDAQFFIDRDLPLDQNNSDGNSINTLPDGMLLKDSWELDFTLANRTCQIVQPFFSDEVDGRTDKVDICSYGGNNLQPLVNPAWLGGVDTSCSQFFADPAYPYMWAVNISGLNKIMGFADHTLPGLQPHGMRNWVGYRVDSYVDGGPIICPETGDAMFYVRRQLDGGFGGMAYEADDSQISLGQYCGQINTGPPTNKVWRSWATPLHFGWPIFNAHPFSFDQTVIRVTGGYFGTATDPFTLGSSNFNLTGFIGLKYPSWGGTIGVGSPFNAVIRLDTDPNITFVMTRFQQFRNAYQDVVQKFVAGEVFQVQIGLILTDPATGYDPDPYSTNPPLWFAVPYAKIKENPYYIQGSMMNETLYVGNHIDVSCLLQEVVFGLMGILTPEMIANGYVTIEYGHCMPTSGSHTLYAATLVKDGEVKLNFFNTSTLGRASFLSPTLKSAISYQPPYMATIDPTKIMATGRLADYWATLDPSTVNAHLQGQTCEQITDSPTCKTRGCFWYNGTCHTTKVCTDINNQADCIANSCFWWDDGSGYKCHPTGPPTPDFTVNAGCPSSPSLSVQQNSQSSCTITVGSLNSFNSAVTLSAGIAKGTIPSTKPTFAFSSNPITPIAGGTATSTLTITVPQATPAGTYTITVTGISGSLNHSVDIALTVTSVAVPCSSHTDGPSCKAAGCFWYNGTCHATKVCTDINNQADCTANSCFWWGNACHPTAEPGKTATLTGTVNGPFGSVDAEVTLDGKTVETVDGAYEFDDVATGNTYTVTVKPKGIMGLLLNGDSRSVDIFDPTGYEEDFDLSLNLIMIAVPVVAIGSILTIGLTRGGKKEKTFY